MENQINRLKAYQNKYVITTKAFLPKSAITNQPNTHGQFTEFGKSMKSFVRS
jgi:hypothetical protein